MKENRWYKDMPEEYGICFRDDEVTFGVFNSLEGNTISINTSDEYCSINLDAGCDHFYLRIPDSF